MTKAFFNVNHRGAGAFSGYGMYFGVQWPLTIVFLFLHVTLSTLIPITIIGLRWPEYHDKPLLGKKGVVLCLTGLILTTLFGMATIGPIVDGRATPYYPNPLLLIGSFIAVILLTWLALRYRNSRITTNIRLFPPFIFGIMGFSSMIAFTISRISWPGLVFSHR
jgi:hypothetical protein